MRHTSYHRSTTISVPSRRRRRRRLNIHVIGTHSLIPAEQLGGPTVLAAANDGGLVFVGAAAAQAIRQPRLGFGLRHRVAGAPRGEEAAMSHSSGDHDFPSIAASFHAVRNGDGQYHAPCPVPGCGGTLTITRNRHGGAGLSCSLDCTPKQIRDAAGLAARDCYAVAPDPLADSAPYTAAVADLLASGFITAKTQVDRSGGKERWVNPKPTRLRHWHGDFYVFNGVGYVVEPEEHLLARQNRFLTAATYFKPGDNSVRPLRVNRTLNLDVLDHKRRICQAIIDRAPAWLDGRKTPDPREILLARNGLVHLDDREGAVLLSKPTPDFFSTNALDYDFDPAAPAPARWLEFLQTLWPDDGEAINTLQEWFGYCLTPDTSLQKMLLMVGRARSGKGTIASVLTAMIGRGNVAGPTLSSLAGNFGLASLIGKVLAVIADARLSNRPDHAIILERLLTISGEGVIEIDRKNRTSVSLKLDTRFVILTNELPRLLDSSGAIVDRFIVLNMTRSWLGREDPTLLSKLLAELPGILLWSIEGRQRLRARGHFQQPQSSEAAIRDFRDLGSPVSAFARDWCELEPAASTRVSEVFLAWQLWCKKQGRRPCPVNVFGRDLRAAAGVSVGQIKAEDDSRPRHYEGLKLKPVAQVAMERHREAMKNRNGRNHSNGNEVHQRHPVPGVDF
jgi:putative DNA primase/helicase